MKKIFLPFYCLMALAVSAQQKNAVFAVTDLQKNGVNWHAIRPVMESTDGEILLKNEIRHSDGEKQPLSQNAGLKHPFAGVAALAFDAQGQRLYYATMFSRQLRYLDLNSGKPGMVELGEIPLGAGNQKRLEPSTQNQGPVITRMTIGADRYGYGISNDGADFFRFALGKNNRTEWLGGLVDDVNNGAVSIQSPCTSWGGDIVAAANGDLYLFTARQMVFKINTESRIATYLGTLKGLKPDFSVNGAAVQEDGSVLLSSAIQAGKRVVVKDMNTLEATELPGENFFNASDLASGNLLFARTLRSIVDKPTRQEAGTVSLYPNPVANGITYLQFQQPVAGNYFVEIIGGGGASLLQKRISIQEKGQQVRLETRSLAKGLYMVRVTDSFKKELYVTKLLVQ